MLRFNIRSLIEYDPWHPETLVSATRRGGFVRVLDKHGIEHITTLDVETMLRREGRLTSEGVKKANS